jgi:IMP dehydrogenase
MIGAPLAAAVEAPGRGFHWGTAAVHRSRPRGTRLQVGTIGTLEEILLGPSHGNDGRLNLFGALRQSMALTGYTSVKEFQKAEVVVTGSGTSSS